MRERLRLTALLLVTACAQDPAVADPGPALARESARAFLADYVSPDGRVVRRDQGGDTVSEGVSYALLLAQVAEDPATERRVWEWASENLRNEDGLLSFRTDASGRVSDPQAATDADLVVAWALGRSSDPALRAEAGPLLEAVQDETVVDRAPGPLLAAGPWATGEPATLNPSYWVLPALRATGLTALADQVAPVLDQLAPSPTLPPDWARLDGARLRASPDPGGRFPQPRYGLDAMRTTVWLAVDCEPANRQRAAAHLALLADRPEASARTLSGAVLDPAPHPLGLVAAAAAASAAGDEPRRDALLDRAAAQDTETPTYYGAAWVALGRSLLQTDVLDDCGATS